ncbi:hypothetical protein [Pedobacter rhodius]|uniref:Right handed beta helix region n=1 Tax=Pedobacter rhodius TaxID=3004098 RepID=A0ABT4KX24_9SPHI|nr:hypothetical protein [Pedobacter sp. SJ11]MCZ4223291.1 hypothetical protein [Pedobacter sp. SJ11]
MRKIFLLVIALFISVNLMAQTPPAIKSIVSKPDYIITYVDGVVIKLKGVNTAAARKAAYEKAYALVHKETKPVFSPPAGIYENISLKNDGEFKLANISKSTLIKINPSNYSNVTFYSFEPLENVVLDLTGSTFDNCNFIFGAGTGLKIYGGEIKNTKNRALKFSFELNNFQIFNTKFINCGDYAIFSEHIGGYDGKESSLNNGFKLMNCTFENSGPIFLGGNLNATEDSGVFKNIEIAYNTFRNSPATGKVFEAHNAWDYDIHHNLADSLNANQNNHNGIFEMQGNGKFHDNKFTNYQGNSIRAWAFSRGNTPATIEIYNNICFNTRKYSGFEIQEMRWLYQPGKTTFANAKVYNNTVGTMNTAKDWEGQILDIYHPGGEVWFYNNLGFDLTTTSKDGITTMINYASGDAKPPILPNFPKEKESKYYYNNKYFTRWEDAVTDLKTFKSKVAGIGADN